MRLLIVPLFKTIYSMVWRKIHSRRPQYILRIAEYVRTHHYVYILLTDSNGSTISKGFMVEKVSHCPSNGMNAVINILFLYINSICLFFIFDRYNSFSSWFMLSNFFSSTAIIQKYSFGGSVHMQSCSSSYSRNSTDNLTIIEKWVIRFNIYGYF